MASHPIQQRVQEAHRWFQQAVHDLRAAVWNLKGGFYNTVCFLAQQGAEKSLKSFLYYSGARRQALLTHSLVEMVTEASGSLGSLKGLINEVRELDLHYIPSRYPNGLPVEEGSNCSLSHAYVFCHVFKLFGIFFPLPSELGES